MYNHNVTQSNVFRIFSRTIVKGFCLTRMLSSFCKKTEYIFRTLSKMSYYAVRTGRYPGIYNSWTDCKKEIDKFPKARYKKFTTKTEAAAFVNGFDQPGVQNFVNPSPSKTASFINQGCSTSKQRSKVSSFQSSPHVSDNNEVVNRLQIAECEIEVLRERLELAEKEKKLLQKEKELELLKQGSKGQNSYKSPPTKKFSVAHGTSPYKRTHTASSADWRQNRTTKLIDLAEARKIHTSHSNGDSGAEPGVVYTDGACVNNGKYGAKAGIGVYWGPGHPLNTSERLPGRQTNNRAEIHAVVRAAKQARQSGLREITVKTDSQFLINSMTKWLPGWKKKGWRTASGEPVKNKEDFVDLERESVGLKINWVHVRGHQGIEGNECADRLAVAGAAMPER